jgi:hypothetical protein
MPSASVVPPIQGGGGRGGKGGGNLECNAVIAGFVAPCRVAHQIDLRFVLAADPKRAREHVARGRSDMYSLVGTRRDDIKVATRILGREQDRHHLSGVGLELVGERVLTLYVARYSGGRRTLFELNFFGLVARGRGLRTQHEDGQYGAHEDFHEWLSHYCL